MFELYPRHGHRTPQQIAEDTGGTFEPTRPYRRATDDDSSNSAVRGAANDPGTPAAPATPLDASQPR
jgi:hypothetical protein